MRIKFCGITQLEDAQIAQNLRVDALGFILGSNADSKVSPRQITWDQCKAITQKLHPFLTRVGVFVNADLDFIHFAMQKCQLDLVQLHGDESPDFCSKIKYRSIKAIAIKDLTSLEKIKAYEKHCQGILLDRFHPELRGGTGLRFDWSLLPKIRQQIDIPLILSGGINPDNIAEALKIDVDGLDISSGIEKTPGIKDMDKMKKISSQVSTVFPYT